MRKIRLALLFALIFAGAKAQTLTPKQLFPGLFEAVQLTDVFQDNKTFADATPKRDPQLIIKDYNAAKGRPGFELAKFVTVNFTLPVSGGGDFKSNISKGVRHHTDINMPLLSGLELAEILPGHQKFVFTTAFSEHALKSFSYHVIDYLLKPISFKRFI